MIPKIQIVTDKNELKYIRTVKDIFYYEYTKSKTKRGKELPLTKDQLDKMIKNSVAIEIK